MATKNKSLPLCAPRMKMVRPAVEARPDQVGGNAEIIMKKRSSAAGVHLQFLAALGQSPEMAVQGVIRLARKGHPAQTQALGNQESGQTGDKQKQKDAKQQAG